MKVETGEKVKREGQRTTGESGWMRNVKKLFWGRVDWSYNAAMLTLFVN